MENLAYGMSGINENSALEAYREAHALYGEIQRSDDSPQRLERIRAQLAVLADCFQRLLKAADANDPAVWHEVGRALNSGPGTKHDVAEAIRWFQRAAEAGHSPAMVNLGLRLLHPRPSRDAAAGLQWLRQAASRGDADGMVFLGFIYCDGTDVPYDPAEAVRWMLQAVEAGDAHAMVHAGRIYARELADGAQALVWFLRAAKAGMDQSYLELAMLYENPELAVYDPAEAYKWYRVVAEYSEGTCARALLAIARQHLEGVGAPCDIRLAKVWLDRLFQVVQPKSWAHREGTELLKKVEGRFL